MSYELVRGALAMFKVWLQVRRFRQWRDELRAERQARADAEYAEFRAGIWPQVVAEYVMDVYLRDVPSSELRAELIKAQELAETEIRRRWEDNYLFWRLSKYEAEKRKGK